MSDKIPVINSLIDRHVDKILIGGAMAYTFFKAEGFNTGKSLVEDDMMDTAREIKARVEAEGVRLVLPTDHQVVDSYDPLNSRKTIPVEFTNQGLVGLDIGRETVALFAKEIEDAKTIIWNGPMGVFEEKGFEEGTVGVALAVAAAAERGRDCHRRRRRLGLRHPAGRRRRQDHTHLDGRRRHPRIPRRRRAARRRCAQRQIGCWVLGSGCWSKYSRPAPRT